LFFLSTLFFLIIWLGHCRVPYKGSQDSFKNPLKQCITGIKEHGHGVTLYRTIDTVNKGADLTIYCILTQIEDWKNRNGYYPEEIYLQVDGGSENANQYLLSMLELLVVKRISKLVYFTRLPTGHTHEDIDACFAIIWRIFRSATCETLEKYKEMIETAFKDSKLNAKMKNVYIIPNFQLLLEGCIDTKLARLHKDIQTQHQWRFEAVKESILFPLGCKTTYRAYSSDVVIEFVKKPQSQCISPIGQFTGLEATTLHCCWYPTQFCDSTRNIEGFYLLRNIPHRDNLTLPPCDFPDNVHLEIQLTIQEIRKTFDVYDDQQIRNTWQKWDEEWAPKTSSATDYIAQMRSRGNLFHIPLKRVLLDKAVTMIIHDWSETDTITNINPDFKWPEVIAAAMNSVVSEFNLQPPNPRLYATNDIQLTDDIERFREKCNNYYDVYLYGLSNVALKILMKRKVGYSGQIMSSTGFISYLINNYFYNKFTFYYIIGTKPTFIKKIKEFDVSFVTTIFKNLSPVNERFVKNKLRSEIRLLEAGNEIVSRIDNVEVSKQAIECLNIAKPFTKEFMSIAIQLFRKHNLRICNSHHETNGGQHRYEQRKPSVFCSPDFFNLLKEDPNSTTLPQYLQNIDWNASYRIYFPVLYNSENNRNDDEWYLLVVDIIENKIYYVNPRCNMQSIPIDDFNRNKMQELRAIINPFLNHFITLHNGIWNVQALTQTYYEVLQNNFDAGIYILNIIYFDVVQCPIYFDEQDIAKFRLQYCYWILNQALPI
jgi:hypothetical protein